MRLQVVLEDERVISSVGFFLEAEVHSAALDPDDGEVGVSI